MIMKRMEYLNLEYLKSRADVVGSITVHNVDKLRNELNTEIEKMLKTSSTIELLVIDMYNIQVTYSDEVVAKESNLFNLFKDVEAKDAIKNLLFVNHFKNPYTNKFLIEKDFPNSKKVLVASFVRNVEKIDDYDDVDIERSENVSDKVFEKVKIRVFGTDSAIDHKESYSRFISHLISDRIESLLLQNKCIENIKEKDHILHSTPVHVNKYVNLKPILENHECFDEICCLLFHQIDRFCGIPDFVVASSRNSIFIASGILKYLEHTNMVIIDQISPVTRLTNFSNLDDIKSNRKYAIIEDFCCMGTEIKLVKSILWSRGVDVESEKYPIHVFPVVSSSLYGNKTDEEFQKRKIHPLHVLDNTKKSEKYLMFTSSCCPICNKINCEHSKEFGFKK